MDSPQQNAISRLGNIAKVFLDIEGDINQLDVLLNGDTDWISLMTQEEIDSVPSFHAAGLTAQNVADFMYLAKTARVQMVGVNLPATIMLANI